MPITHANLLPETQFHRSLRIDHGRFFIDIGLYLYHGIVCLVLWYLLSVNSFKSRLDKFWSMHDFVYDYRADPLAA